MALARGKGAGYNTNAGAGQLGAGQMTLANAGTILANGANALVIDTGTNVVTNSGTLEATGSGGLVVESGLANTGSLVSPLTPRPRRAEQVPSACRWMCAS